MKSAPNLYDDLPTHQPKEQVQILRESSGLRIERIVSRGHSSPEGDWYDQPWSEFVVVLRGAAWLQFEGDESSVELTAGSFLDIPAHRRHRVMWTDPDQPTIWLAVHYGS